MHGLRFSSCPNSPPPLEKAQLPIPLECCIQNGVGWLLERSKCPYYGSAPLASHRMPLLGKANKIQFVLEYVKQHYKTELLKYYVNDQRNVSRLHPFKFTEVSEPRNCT
ncbi:UNVERIFIED_CONTAM: hypothetical protein K2H54_060764 [Gekko kuhli]